MNASLAFFGFIMYYPLLAGHVGFWQSPFFINFGYNLLSELRKCVFLCRLAVKMLLFKQNTVHLHPFLESFTILSFSAAILDLAAILIFFYSHNGTLSLV